MKYLLLLLIINCSFSILAQEKTPYNDEFTFLEISSETELPKSAIKALIVNFTETGLSNFEKTIRNNTQLIEIQLFQPTQAALDILERVAGDSLQYLFITTNQDTLSIGNLPSLELLSISSDSIRVLNTDNCEFANLGILQIIGFQLKVWNSTQNLPKIHIIHLIAPNLNVFPITSSPDLFQMDFTCSFNEIPAYLCDCKELSHISFNNLKNISVDECFAKKLLTASYSNITIYERSGGTVLHEILSPDRKKK